MVRLTPEDFAAVEELPVHMAGAPVKRTAEVLGEIEGISCNDTGYAPEHPRARPVTRFEALFHLRLAAADRDADAVAEVRCEPRAGGALAACHGSVVCTGLAVRNAPTQGTQSAPAAPADDAGDADGTAEDDGFLVPLGFTPDYLTETQRAALGRLGIGVLPGVPGSRIEAPLTPKQAAAWGAGQWFLNCIGQGGYFGLIISPACALLGATVGATSAADPETLESTGEAIVSALRGAYDHGVLRDEVVRVARSTTGAEFDVLEGPSGGDDAPAPDTVLEVGVDELLLPAASQGAVTNLPSPITVRARARVMRVADGAVLYDRAYGFTTEARRFTDWGAENGAPVRHALELGYRDIAERIVDDVLLAYPLMPVFGAASMAQDSPERRYLVEPFAPARHGYDYEGRAWPTSAGTLEPTFSWAPFPSPAARAADFQGRLDEASAVAYDLRLYRIDQPRGAARLVLERQGIERTRYTLDQPLAPGTLYVWTVRARFELGEAGRTTRWSGDWLSGKVKGFLFYTPR
jgi:hypothetical protein